MATTTSHFGIIKPASNENYSLQVVNTNSETIDNQMYNNQQSAAKIMVGASANADGQSGRVPAPLIADKDKYLKGDGTWDTPSGGGSSVTITPTLSSGTKIADYSIDGVSDSLYAPSGGGGGGIDYSTTEQDTGVKWIDGSTVYEKVISIINVSLSSGSYETVDTITGLDTIISCNGYVVEGNLKYTLNDISLRVIQDGTSVKLYSPSGTTWTISSGAIIIRYTKASS